MLGLGFGEALGSAVHNAQAAPPITVTYTRRQKKSTAIKLPSRNPLPSHLRREEIIIEPAEDVSALKKIGDEITEELEYEPGELYVKRYIRPKYARSEAEGVVVATLPSRPIAKGIAGPGLLAHVLMSKFVDHLTLYRQRQQFRRLGVEISGSTIDGWVAGSCELLLPLYHAQRQIIQRASYLQADETRIPVWSNVNVLGAGESLNQSLEKAGRVADFLELAELMCVDALHREESCGGHFRLESQTREGEAKRDDERFSYVAAWEHRGEGQGWELHREPLSFENVHLAQRSYK